jgi:tetratricopeptide (TPR) repeat protein
MPLYGGLYYRAAYQAYQARRWDAAATASARAERWQPLNAQTRQLYAMSLINLGQYDQARAAYQDALDKRPDYAPYHAQLGWLHWLNGDLAQAQFHLERAVEMDPREAWRKGVHAELALIYVAQGRTEYALPLLAKTLELDPQMALAPYWLRGLASGGAYEVRLDPVYVGPAPDKQEQALHTALQSRILAHVGQADYTPRLFDHDLDLRSPLSLNQVLDVIQADYRSARVQADPEAPRLLAAAAEAAQLAGLYSRAERAYQVFQEAYPTSAYGFYGMGTLYQEQGRLAAAQAMLEIAVELSPDDEDAWTALAQVHLEQTSWSQARQALDALHALDPLDINVYRLRADLYQEQGTPLGAAASLRRALYVRESVSERLALADLYGPTDERRAARQCRQAWAALLQTGPRLWDVQLYQVGACFADYGVAEPRVIVGEAQPALDQVLLGHIRRAQGRPWQALSAYQSALDTLSPSGPDVGAAHYFIAETYQGLGKQKWATEAYQAAAQHAPLESLPWLALGRLHEAQGRRDAALESFYSAAAVTPGDEAAQTALGNAMLTNEDRLNAARRYRLAQIAAGDLDDRAVYDFVASLAEADVRASDPAFVRNSEFTIDGLKQRVLFMHPESQARVDLELGQDTMLAFQIAMDPFSWTEAGDGTTFDVTVLPGPVLPGWEPGDLVPDTGPVPLWSTYIDPKQNPGDRRWHPVTLDLSAYTGRKITLVLGTSSGPAGDNRYDWAGWGAPRLLRTLD